MEIHLDGERLEVPEGTRLGDLLPDRDPRCSVAVIRPAEVEAAATRHVRFVTTAGDIVVEIGGKQTAVPLDWPDLVERLRLHWADRYAAAFGPFPSEIQPLRALHRYERGDVILGCGGYDPNRSYLIFSRMRHTADYGAPADGGVVGKVVTGQGLIDRWSAGDRILGIERLLARADRYRGITTTDGAFPLEEGMRIESYVVAGVQGYAEDRVDTQAAWSAEHFLLSVQDGHFVVGRSSSTHIRDERLVQTRVPLELSAPRLEGTVTVRTSGRSAGAVYIYTQGVSASPAHTVVGRVLHGIELVRLAEENDVLCIRAEPQRFDLIGLSVMEARRVAEMRGIRFTADETADERVVVEQNPATTLEVLAAGAVSVSTLPLGQVIGIRLDDERAPRTTAIFREVSGLKHHSVGKVPFIFRFEDVLLFKPRIPKGVGIIPENVPEGEVPAYTLAMTNDSRKGAGMVGVRTTSSSEFGPTAEPLTGTNIIGAVVDVEKLEGLEEGTTVYVRDVKR